MYLHPTPVTKRRTLRVLIIVGGLLVGGVAVAQSDRPVKIILPVATASGVDTITRAASPALSKALGAPVVVDNQPPSGSVIINGGAVATNNRTATLTLAASDALSSVTQREIGSDTSDFKMGLRAALRQDPDVIMIGEMRDAETVDTAIKAAETGHLLMSTLHTPDAQSTILRIMAMFPPEEQNVIRIRLAESLSAIISQRLLPKISGKGRAVATEIMINTPAIKDLILEGTRIGEIKDFIAEGRDQYGMQTFDQCLTDLVTSGEVTFETAKSAASNPSDFELKMTMFSRVSTAVKAAAIPSEEQLSQTTPGGTQLEGMQTSGMDFLSQ